MTDTKPPISTDTMIKMAEGCTIHPNDGDCPWCPVCKTCERQKAAK